MVTKQVMSEFSIANVITEKLIRLEMKAKTKEEIKQADVVIIAADIKIGGKERFEGKKVIEIPTNMVIKAPKGLITKIEEELSKT